ncbi:hypothetical protein CEE37_07390 [candidate division LCP-89 bacterium B3_LCP]|uniref:Probable membrane transporter protein n=1 Tax=candidate division LCP-89 bacterium B3_LCP TaxID=2012998 RepID=A0A532V134_UNCL8|nr:MAG: hypothetical protein CEE37_07390 [candidate division LCP-89 bacterium B3_LCP]
MHFPISGVETYWWLPIAVMFVISTLTSMGGVSGAFLLLPFQISVLGFTSPAVSPTNMIYNIVAIPSGVLRYYREKRIVWPLVITMAIAYLPGIFIGAIIRIKYLPDPGTFKLFAGLVLLYIGVRLGKDIFRKESKNPSLKKGDFEITDPYINLKKLGYVFNGESYTASTLTIGGLSLLVGVVGGIYGIGGGAIMAPLLVAMFRLPVHTIAGAALLGTFISSVAGAIIYTVISPYFSASGLSISPDWLLGFMFGIGGAAGMYTGARLQRYIPARAIKVLLTCVLLFVSGKYVLGFFL